MRVLIVGAGVGGLATGVAMRRLGHDVVIVERANELTEVGAGVVLGSHAMRALDHLGAADAIRSLNEPPSKFDFFDMLTGDLTMTTTMGDVGETLYGTKTYTTHRRDLIDALAAQLDGAQVRLGSSVLGLRQDDIVSLQIANGDKIEGDILIGADGLRSTIRTEIFGETPSHFTGYLAWRTVMPATNYPFSFKEDVHLWLGAGRHAVCYPIRHGQQIYAAFYVPEKEVQREGWQVSGDVNDLKASFVDACPGVRKIIDGITEAFITGVFYRSPLEQWYSGRVLLLGDAAHPVLSTSGSGAAITLEDAVAIGACMARHGDDYRSAFEEFQARRKPRTSEVLTSSRADLENYHETDPVRRGLRGKIAAGVMRLDPTGYERIAWLNGYNEVAQSAKPFSTFVDQNGNLLKRAEARRAFDLWRGMFNAEDHIHGWTSQRLGYERFMVELDAVPEDVHVEQINCNGTPALRVVPAGGEDGPAIVHLHGGAFVFGSPRASLALAARLARAIGGWAIVPDFRLVPEHSIADMIADAMNVFDWTEASTPAVFVSGECSGGGLAVSLAIALRDAERRQPQALYLISPLADATLSASSITANAATEAWLSKRMLLPFIGALTQGADPAAAAYSPINANLAGLAPLRVFAASGEALADDASILVDRARAAGVDARLTLIEDSVHSFALFEFLPEAKAFIESVGQDSQAFLREYDGAAASGV